MTAVRPGKEAIPLDKKRMTYVTMGFGMLLLLVLLLLVWGGHRRSAAIVLPENQSEGSPMGPETPDSRLNTISITPETVQPAIAALSRPAAYSRTQQVETFWSGGSGQSSATVYVSGGRTRLDASLPDGSVRHTLVVDGPGEGESTAGVWYDDETQWRRLRADGQTADQTARMPTYETVRDIPARDIAQADFREAYGGGCIYVETRIDAEGYLDRYWVSTENGLLLAAERLWRGELIYRFTAGEPDISPQEDSLFLLPDGSELTDGETT